MKSPLGNPLNVKKIINFCCFIEDDTVELVLQEVEVNRDEIRNESLEEHPGTISSSCEVDSIDEIVVKSFHVKPSRFVYLRTTVAFLVSLTLLIVGILARLIL